MGESPFEILGEQIPTTSNSDYTRWMYGLGFPQLAHALEAIGFMCAIIVILLSMLTLLFVNYPKTVAQTKQRIVQAFLSVVFIAVLPLFMDVIVNACIAAFY